jgi:hypothetical protein
VAVAAAQGQKPESACRHAECRVNCGMHLGWTAEEIGGLARDCFNEVTSLSKTEAGRLN